MKSFCQDQTVLQKCSHYLMFETEIEETGWNFIFLNYYLLFQVSLVPSTVFLHWYQLDVWHFINIISSISFNTLICDVFRNLVPFAQFKNLKNTHGRVSILVKLQECLACNFTKINTLPWVFFTFLKLYKWYQIAQRTTYKVRLKIEYHF